MEEEDMARFRVLSLRHRRAWKKRSKPTTIDYETLKAGLNTLPTELLHDIDAYLTNEADHQSLRATSRYLRSRLAVCGPGDDTMLVYKSHAKEYDKVGAKYGQWKSSCQLQDFYDRLGRDGFGRAYKPRNPFKCWRCGIKNKYLVPDAGKSICEGCVEALKCFCDWCQNDEEAVRELREIRTEEIRLDKLDEEDGGVLGSPCRGNDCACHRASQRQTLQERRETLFAKINKEPDEVVEEVVAEAEATS